MFLFSDVMGSIIMHNDYYDVSGQMTLTGFNTVHQKQNERYHMINKINLYLTICISYLYK